MFDNRIEIVEKVVFPKDDRKEVEFTFERGSCWQGAKLKDFWCRDNEWDKMIVSGSQIRLWTIQWSRVIGFEVLRGNKWESVWCVGNDFDTKEEAKKKSDAYGNFIIKEGNKVAKLIDKGKTYKQIDKLMSKEHSGNTHACSLKVGVSRAKNKENANRVRIEFNKEWGVDEKQEGIVNPAVMTIGK